jgi:uncharacterized repeat protein (TIGR01451 family)
MKVLRVPAVPGASPRAQAAALPGLAAVVGDTLIYTIVISNGGPAVATNVRVNDVLSATTPIVSATSTQGSCALLSPSSVGCRVDTIAVGATVTVTVTARAVASGSATSTATVVADQQAANPADLQATTTVAVTPAPPPVYNRSVNLIPVSGKVSYRLPNARTFVPLLSLINVPARTEVNAINGIAGVVSARNPTNAQQTGKFTGGRFVVSYRQPYGPIKSKKQRLLVTQLRLSAPLKCPKRTTANSDEAKNTRSLWGNAKGDFRTVGRFAAATVRGTEWFTADTCRSTTIRVRRGNVDVLDFLRRKHVAVVTGHSYTHRS